MNNIALDKRLNELCDEAEPLIEKLENGTITKAEKQRLNELNKEADKIYIWYNIEMF